LGTEQAAFLYLFTDYAEPLMTCSLTLSAGILSMRAAIGQLFACEYTRETIEAAREIQV
jgi:hypothetical protein